MGLFDKFKNGLEKSRNNFTQSFEQLFKGKELGENFYDELEESLILGDVGVETSIKIINKLKSAFFII